MREYKVCVECKHFVRTEGMHGNYGRCTIKNNESDKLGMRRTYTKSCRKYEEQKE